MEINLTRHRKDNLNISSVWLCSRNDIIANTSVLIAAELVFLTHSVLPDLAVGLLLTFIFAKSAGKVLSQSWREIETIGWNSSSNLLMCVKERGLL
jgi:Co/Zn/Cd efflux system component